MGVDRRPSLQGAAGGARIEDQAPAAPSFATAAGVPAAPAFASVPPPPAFVPVPPAPAPAPSIRTMKAAIVAAGLSVADLVEKRDVVERYRQALAAARPAAPVLASPADPRKGP